MFSSRVSRAQIAGQRVHTQGGFATVLFAVAVVTSMLLAFGGLSPALETANNMLPGRNVDAVIATADKFVFQGGSDGSITPNYSQLSDVATRLRSVAQEALVRDTGHTPYADVVWIAEYELQHQKGKEVIDLDSVLEGAPFDSCAAKDSLEDSKNLLVALSGNHNGAQQDTGQLRAKVVAACNAAMEEFSNNAKSAFCPTFRWFKGEQQAPAVLAIGFAMQRDAGHAEKWEEAVGCRIVRANPSENGVTVTYKPKGVGGSIGGGAPVGDQGGSAKARLLARDLEQMARSNAGSSARAMKSEGGSSVSAYRGFVISN